MWRLGCDACLRYSNVQPTKPWIFSLYTELNNAIGGTECEIWSFISTIIHFGLVQLYSKR